jgi:hypothetical protein
MHHSILSGLQSDRIVHEPYPYVIVPDALEAAYYAELARSFPSLERIAGRGPFPSNRVFRMPACDVLPDLAIPAIWRDFFAYHCSGAFLGELVAFWHDVIYREYPSIETWFGKPLTQVTTGVRVYQHGRAPEHIPANMHSDAMLDCQFVVNSPVTKPSSVRGPHLDKPYKLFAAILYLRDPEDGSTGGNHRLERFKTQRYHFDRHYQVADRCVEPFAEVPYAPNTLVLWLNTPRSVHSVTPRSVTAVPRRYINLLTECYRLPAGGFFPLPRALPTRVYRSVAQALRRRAMHSGTAARART